MEVMTAKEEADFARLDAKRKRVARQKKAFLSDCVEYSAEVVEHLLRECPEAVISAVEKAGYTVVKAGDSVQTSGEDFGTRGGRNSADSVQTSMSENDSFGGRNSADDGRTPQDDFGAFGSWTDGTR